MKANKILHYFIILTIIILGLGAIGGYFLNLQKQNVINKALEVQQMTTLKMIVEQVHSDLLVENSLDASRKLNLLIKKNIITQFNFNRDLALITNKNFLCEAIYFDKETKEGKWGELCVVFPPAVLSAKSLQLDNVMLLIFTVFVALVFLVIFLFNFVDNLNRSLFTEIELVINSKYFDLNKTKIWEPVLSRIADIVQKKNNAERLLLEKKIEIELVALSKQVAHDIRSPLSALNAAMESAKQISGQERVVINSALQRINDIANDLLQKGKQAPEVCNLELTSENILAIVTQIISEKKMQFREQAKLIIETDLPPSTGILVKVNSKELSRVISNLINNAVEALENHNGKIIVGVTKFNQQVEITIQDNGTGIPSKIIKRLGEEGFSHKKDGNGLGLFHAKQTIEKFNGKLTIESVEQQGTTIRILLPAIDIAQTNNYDIVLLDNDPLVRMTWEMKAKRNNKKILCLATYSELKSQLNTIDRNTNFYIDVHLSDSEDGVQIAKELFDLGFSNLYLATGYEPEKFSHVTWIKGVVGKSPVV